MSVKYHFSEKTYSVREARANFSAIIQESQEFGCPITITKFGKPVARLVSSEKSKKKQSVMAKKVALGQQAPKVKSKQSPVAPISPEFSILLGVAAGKNASANKAEDKEIIGKARLEKYFNHENLS